MSFRVEYKRPGGTAMFQRNVRFHVDITCATPPQENTTNGNLDKNGDKPTIYCITFTLISGNKKTLNKYENDIRRNLQSFTFD